MFVIKLIFYYLVAFCKFELILLCGTDDFLKEKYSNVQDAQITVSLTSSHPCLSYKFSYLDNHIDIWSV